MSKHGGAWKVAYADFITAMMALFMVLWILGSEEELLEQLQEYFRNPPSPFERQAGKFPVDIDEFSGHTSSEATEAYFDSVDPAVLKNLVSEFYKMLDLDANRDRLPSIEIAVTSDGLRVILFDRQDTPLFEDGRSKLTSWGDLLAQNLSWLISRYPFRVVIESHSGERDVLRQHEWSAIYGPWELSTDRANELRRQLEFYSNGDMEIRRVSGYGTMKPLEGLVERGRTHQRVTLALSLKGPDDAAEIADSVATLDQKRHDVSHQADEVK